MINDHSGGAYSTSRQIRFKTSMLRSDLCNCSDACIIIKGPITVDGAAHTDKYNRKLIFKNNAPFTNCISKINNVLIDNGEDFDLVMPMYNLIEYSRNYRKTTGSLWNYYRNEPADPLTDSEYQIQDNYYKRYTR